MAKINPDFAKEIQKYGAENFNACYNCGNCTAICNLTEKNANFPRMFIRYGMLGLEEEIIRSKELWLCYACGECTTSCPRQAAPGDYMAALRRYAIARYEPTGLTKLLFKNNIFSIVITLFIAIILGFFLLSIKPEMLVSRWIFEYLPFQVVHDIGMLIFLFTGLSILWGAVKMIIKLSKQVPVTKEKAKRPLINLKAIAAVITELSNMKRYRNCDTDDAFWKAKPFYLQPWFIHWSVMWGFIGLLVATTLDFILKDPSTDIWFPSRILGTLAGLLMMYGATMAIYYRKIRITDSYANTRLPDRMFLFFLWIAGFTGFWLEVAVSISSIHFINQIVFIIHTIISMELVLLFSFSKFAHALYRTLALFFHFSEK